MIGEIENALVVGRSESQKRVREEEKEENEEENEEEEEN